MVTSGNHLRRFIPVRAHRTSGTAGQALFPLVLAVVLTLGLTGIAMAGAGFLQSLLAAQRTFAEQARQTARGGIDDALLRMTRDKNWPTTLPATYVLPVGSETASITISNDASAPVGHVRRFIESSTTVRNVQRRYRAHVEISPTGTITVLSRDELTS